MSERHVLANRLAKIIRENRLGKDTAQLVELNNKKFYQIPFQNGRINVYGPDFIQIEYVNGAEADDPVFESFSNANRFFKLAFLKGELAEAKKIPRKKPPETLDNQTKLQ